MQIRPIQGAFEAYYTSVCFVNEAGKAKSRLLSDFEADLEEIFSQAM